MKKIIYTMTLLLAAYATQAQTPIKQAKEAIADVYLLHDNLLVYSKKEKEGQYIYTETKGATGAPEKNAALNAGTVNAVIGENPATGELFVYQQLSRKDRRLAVYSLRGGAFVKTEERELPKFTNHSYNLGMFLTRDKQHLYITAELGKSKGYDDIYLSQWLGSKWSKPVSVGRSVNTREAEFSPFVSGDSLYFSRKQGSLASVYVVPLSASSAPTGEPVRLGKSVNLESGFNAYYTKAGNQELWLTADASGTGSEAVYTVYLKQPVLPEAKEVEVKEIAADEPVAAPVKTEAPTKQTLYFGFNEVFMGGKAEQELRAFLEALEPGAALVVKGYSDRQGPARGRLNVSRKRAAFVKWYIDNKFSEKNIRAIVDHEVLDQQGEPYMKVEVSLQ